MTTPYYQVSSEHPHASGLNTQCPQVEIAPIDGSVTIEGFIRDSGNLPLTDGWLRVTADATLVDYSGVPNVIATKRPHKFPIVNGYISFNLINSADARSTYRFDVGYDEEVSIGVNRETITDTWHAAIPRVAGKISLSELVPVEINTQNLDQSVRRLASLILGDSGMRKSLAPFRPTGPFNAAKSYQYGDIVYLPLNPSNGQSWLYIGSSQSLPPTSIGSNWVQLS